MRTAKRNAKEENNVTRMKVGHTRLISTLHLISKHPAGFLDQCQSEESVKHRIEHCQKYTRKRKTLKTGIRSSRI